MTKVKNGFTLIELLFVIAVLGLLSTVGILFYQQRMQNQKIEKTVAQIMQWQQAAMAYYVKNKKWPPTEKDLMPEFMPAGSADKNPWCNKKGECYTVQVQPNSQLLQVTAQHLPAAPNSGGGIPAAIAARLPYASPVEAGATSVIGIINRPLAGLEVTPEILIMDIVPFTLDGQKFRPAHGGGNQPLSLLQIDGGGRWVTKAFPCRDTYGDNYSFVPYVVVSSYKGGDLKKGSEGTEPNPHVLSYFDVKADVEGDWVILKGFLRPQRYYQKTGGDQVNITSRRDEAIIPRTMEIAGYIFFMCCKENACQKQPEPGR